MAEAVVDVLARLDLQVNANPIKAIGQDLARLLQLQSQEVQTTKNVNEQILLEQKIRANVTKEIERNNRERAREEKQLEAVTNDYKLLSKAQQEAALRAKNYALALGATHPITVQATQDARQMQQTLTQLDFSVGQFTRNVGNYNNVGQSFNQILRELPNAGLSLNTFVVSLSNNLTYFGESIKTARAEGQSWGQVLGTLRGSLFGFVGIMNIAVLGLTILSKWYDESSRSAKKAKEETEDYTEALQKQITAQHKATQIRGNEAGIGARAIKREIDLLEAQGASETAIASKRKEYNAARTREAQNEIEYYDFIIGKAKEYFDRFNEGSVHRVDVNRWMSTALKKDLMETLHMTEEEAKAEAVAIAETYNTRESIVAKFNMRIKELTQEKLDIVNDGLVEEAKADTEAKEEAAKAAEKAAKANEKSIKDAERLAKQALSNLKDFARQMQDSFNISGQGSDADKIRTDFLKYTAAFNKVKEDQDKDEIKRNEAISAARAKRFDDSKKIFDKEQQQQKDEINAWGQVANAAISAFDLINQARQQSLQREYQYQTERVRQAERLAERGNEDILKIELDRLNELQKKQEEVAQQQLLINAALAVSNSVVAIARVAADTSIAAPVAIPLVIGAILSGFAAVSAAARASTGFAEGVVNLQGEGTGTSDSIPARLSKGESVITAKATSSGDNAAMLSMMNAGHAFKFADTPMMNNSYATTFETKGITRRLDSLVEAVQGNRVKFKFVQDARGFGMYQEQQIKKTKDRYKH